MRIISSGILLSFGGSFRELGDWEAGFDVLIFRDLLGEWKAGGMGDWEAGFSFPIF
jgi:hypothetical protein